MLKGSVLSSLRALSLLLPHLEHPFLSSLFPMLLTLFVAQIESGGKLVFKLCNVELICFGSLEFIKVT